MFDMGFWEVSLIAIVALVIVGPERLPGLARTVGLYVGKARRVLRDVKSEIDQEINRSELTDMKDLKNTISDAKTQIDRATSDVAKTLNKDVMKDDLDGASSDAKPSNQIDTQKDAVKEAVKEIDGKPATASAGAASISAQAAHASQSITHAAEEEDPVPFDDDEDEDEFDDPGPLPVPPSDDDDVQRG